jgi:DNA repair protein RadC
LAPPKEDGDRSGGSLLVALLRPLNPAQAEAWTGSLIAEFRSLAGALAATGHDRRRLLGDGAAADFLAVVSEAIAHVLREDVMSGPVLSTGQALLGYLHATMAHRSDEQVRALYLDAGNRLLKDEVVATGSARETVLQPRVILRRALELNASALIIAHNHPSGDPTPSTVDHYSTRALAEGARALDIVLHDHIIVARSGSTSLRALGVL